ncbi:MAG: imidazole glycerol phosphate synthase subunit HisH [Pyrinomonadaceae bacterium]
MTVAILKYNAGNIASVQNALSRLGADSIVTHDAIELRAADKVIFPGVGEASTAMQYLRERGLDDVIRSLTQPVLGVCLGMQLLCASSEENDATGLGIFANRVRRFEGGSDLKVPHIGWNTISNLRSELFADVADASHVYFVHGYYVEPSSEAAAVTNYGIDFAAAIVRDNFFAVQFHPERSGAVGERILQNFLNL